MEKQYCVVIENHGRLFASAPTNWEDALKMARSPHGSTGWIVPPEVAQAVNGKFANDVEVFPHYDANGHIRPEK